MVGGGGQKYNFDLKRFIVNQQPLRNSIIEYNFHQFQIFKNYKQPFVTPKKANNPNLRTNFKKSTLNYKNFLELNNIDNKFEDMKSFSRNMPNTSRVQPVSRGRD